MQKPADKDKCTKPKRICGVHTAGVILVVAATIKYNMPCAYKRSFKGDLDGSYDSFTTDNRSMRRS